MGSENWTQIKQSKRFNVSVYRRGLTMLIFSLILSGVLSVLITLHHLAEPERAYYATSGITPPVALKVMFNKNNSSKALLDPDPPTDNVVKVLPD